MTHITNAYSDKLKVKKLDTRAIIPTKAHKGDAGYDLYALEDTLIKGTEDGGTQEIDYKPSKVKTGISFEIPEGFVGLLWDRSSRGSNGFKVMGGVIDSTYRGEVIVCLTKFGQSATIAAGEKIAQIIFQPVEHFELIETSELSDSTRGEKGFGSSGK